MTKFIFFTVFILSIIISSCSPQRNVNIYQSGYIKKIISKPDGNVCNFYYNNDGIEYKITVSYNYSEYFSLFEQGIIHPNLIGCFQQNVMYIGKIEESIIPSDSSKRNYKFWQRCEGMINPCEYRIRLYNENAKFHTSTKDFLSGARLVNISQCSLIL